MIYRLVIPILITPALENPEPWEMDALDRMRQPLQDWWLAYGHGLLCHPPVYQAHPDSLAAFVADPFQKAVAVAARTYDIPQHQDRIALLAVRGLTSEHLGRALVPPIPRNYGAGALQYAVMAWDLFEQGAACTPGEDDAWWRRLCGLACHEVGHALGWPHDFVTPRNVMGYEWWHWPGVGVAAPAPGVKLRLVGDAGVGVGVGVGVGMEACLPAV